MVNQYLILTRGVPGSGKSTFIKNTFDTNFVIISPDEVRLTKYGLNEHGRISQGEPSVVWNIVNNKLYSALSLKKSIIFDSTASTKSLLKRCLKLATENNYKLIIIDFTSVNVDTCICQNKSREYYKFVPEEILYKIHEKLIRQDLTAFKEYIIDYRDFDIRSLI